MNTSIAKVGAGVGLINREELARSLNATAMEIPTSGGLPFLKMDRGNGQFFYGQEETPVEDGSIWAANPMSLKKGWVAWDSNAGGKPVQEIMVPFARTLPDVASLPPLGMSAPNKKTGKSEQLVYQQQYSVEFVCVTGEDEGTVVEYKQSSGGAVKLFSGLTNAILDKIQKGNDIVPLGVFKSERYKNDTHGGYTYNPIFEIVEWRTPDDDSAPSDAPKAEEPKATRTRAAAPAKTPEPPAEGSADEEAALAAEYEAAQGQAEVPAAPRRRVRR